MDKPLDVLIIGAGHNGLTCACYLAAAGLSVRVVERRSVVGGAAVTEEFFPGFRNSTASYTVSLLDPQVMANNSNFISYPNAVPKSKARPRLRSSARTTTCRKGASS